VLADAGPDAGLLVGAERERIVLQRAAVPYGRFLGLPTVLHGGSEIMKPPLVGRTVLSLVPEEAFHRRRGSTAAVFGNTSGDGSSCLQGQPGITRPQGASGRRQEMSARRASVISSGTCGHAASEPEIGVEYLSHRKTMVNGRIASTHDQRPAASSMEDLRHNHARRHA
jgi:hypothetical protein